MIAHILTDRPMPMLGTTTGVSLSGSLISFAVDWLPVVQLAGAIVALIAGVFSIAYGAWLLKEAWIKDHGA